MPRRPWLWIACAAVLVYGWAATFDFAWLDDYYLIGENVRYLSNPSSIVTAFTQGYFNVASQGLADMYYRPLVTVSFIIDALIAPGSPFMGHVTNVLLHAGAACLAFLLLCRVGARRDAAFWLGLLFAVHPLAGNAVGWLPGRNDTLMAIFAMASFIAALDFLRTGSRRAAAIAAAAFAAALLSKETAVALVPAVAAYAWFGTAERFPRARVLAIGAAAGVLLAAWLAARHAVLGATVVETTSTTTTSALDTAPLIVLQTVGKCVLPVNLSVYPVLVDTSSVWGVLSIAVIAWIAWRRPGLRRLAGFGAAWFLLFLAPSFFAKVETVPTMFECRMYLPLLGVMMIVGDAVGRITTVEAVTPRARAAAAALLVAMAVTAVIDLAPYRNRVAFWESAAQSSPDSPIALGSRGAMYLPIGRVAEAERDFRAALALNPTQPRMHYSLGSILYARGQLDSAAMEFRKELEINPGYEPAVGDMGALMYQRGNAAEAMRWFQRSVTANPEYIRGWQGLALLYTAQGDRPHAAECAAHLAALGVPVPPQVAAFVNGR